MRNLQVTELVNHLPSVHSSILNSFLIYASFIVVKWLSRFFISNSNFRNIPGPPSQSWFKGNLGQLFNAKGLPFHQELVDRYGGMVRVYGFFGDEQLYISDPRALQSIILKDQDAFEENPVFTDTNNVIFGPGLVSTTGDQHKRQRKIVKPIFSVAQLRLLTPVFYDIADRLYNVLAREITQHADESGGGVLDMSEWMSRVALEAVGQTVLGYSFDPLDTPYNNRYTSAVKELIPTVFSLSLMRQFVPFLSRIGSPAFRRKMVEWIPHKAVQKVKNISDVMHETAQSILEQKRRTLELEGEAPESSLTKDIISVLLRVNDNAEDGAQLSEAELTGQMTVLIFGAQDTSSSALSRILYMLSVNPEAQRKAREEIQDALRAKNQEEGSDRLSYDEINALPWLDAILKETLRLYPPVTFVRRTAIKERAIPYSSLADDPNGVNPSWVTIPVGTTLFVGIAGCNRLESIWGADAKEWKPERWLAGDGRGMGSSLPKDSRPRLPGIYAGTMSFLGGGRACVGYKFAEAEMKILLATMLNKFTFTSTNDEIVWNLSQIISPSVRTHTSTEQGELVEEKNGLPLFVSINNQS